MQQIIKINMYYVKIKREEVFDEIFFLFFKYVHTSAASIFVV